jgi:hypothetical protein
MSFETRNRDERRVRGSRPGRKPANDRESWDRATWNRYLAAATRLESTYGPRMRRLRREIEQLERLMTLLTAS